MTYLLFVAKSGPYDHDLTLDDFVKCFDKAEQAMDYYDSTHNSWPYSESCGFEDCQIETHPISKQRMHIHNGCPSVVIHRPDALVASWDGHDFLILFRSEGWSSMERKISREGWTFGEDAKEIK